jgi:glutaredoxin-like protein DUF836
MLQLQLLSTDHCSLCDQALDLLLDMPELAGLGLEVIDITSDDKLLLLYGERIPVLLGTSHGQLRELAAPFERKQVLAWLDAWQQQA